MGTIRLTDNERKALKAWQDDEGYVLPFKYVETRSGLPGHLVRRTVRSLARKGLTALGTGFSEDDGLIAGRGYELTPVGQSELRAMLAERSK